MMVNVCQEHGQECVVAYAGHACPVCELIEDLQCRIDALYDPEDDEGSEQADRKSLESWNRCTDKGDHHE